MMAGKHQNIDYYQNLSPSMVVPDHFACNQCSTIVIIYDEPVGTQDNSVSFVFPGESSGETLKKVIPQRIDSRTFVIRTPIYDSSRRGFIHVTPQLKLGSGELTEMSNIKITLKHPVRSVMELCLGLSTQNAVLPVLLTLIIHSQQKDSQNRCFFQDPHFDRIMATLVGSMKPGTRQVRDIILPDKKWRKSSLASFAREFKMQEMEKQAYLLNKRGKDKRRSKYIESAQPPLSDEEDDENPPPTPLFESHFSLSTPDIHRASAIESCLTSYPRLSINESPTHRRKRNKALPMVPWKQHHQDKDEHLYADPESERDGFQESVYDPILFDIGEIKSQRKSTKKKPPDLPKIKKSLTKNSLPIKPTTDHEHDKEETGSLDSYEEMNDLEGDAVADLEREWKRQDSLEPNAPSVPLRVNSVYTDPEKRPMMPLPENTPDPPKNVPYYSESTKKKKKFKMSPEEPKPPPEPKCPPPPSKRPLPVPKPQSFKGNLHSKPRVRRNKDIYIPESNSESENDCDNDNEPTKAEAILPEPKKKSYVNMEDSFDVVGDHLYDCPVASDDEEKKSKKKTRKREKSVTQVSQPAAVDRPSNTKYQNVPEQSQETVCEPSNDHPTFPPKPSPISNAVPDSFPQRKTSKKKPTPPPPSKPKSSPTPPLKILPVLPQKPSPDPPPKLSPILPVKANVKKTPSFLIKGIGPSSDQLSELSSVFSSRNAKGSHSPPLPPAAPKKKVLKKPQLPQVGGMKSYI